MIRIEQRMIYLVLYVLTSVIANIIVTKWETKMKKIIYSFNCVNYIEKPIWFYDYIEQGLPRL